MQSGDHAKFVRLLARALAYLRAPKTHAKHMANDPIQPAEFALLFRLAGGAPLEKFGLEADRVRDPSELRAAARAYIELVMFREGADHYRILGLLPHATTAEIKEHHRLLMRLAHPDRGVANAKWLSAHASRINQAYNALSLAVAAGEAYQAGQFASDHTIWEGVTGLGGGSAHAAHSFYERQERRRSKRALLAIGIMVALAAALILAVVYFDAAPGGGTTFSVLNGNAPAARPANCPEAGRPETAPGDMTSQVQRAMEARLCAALPPGDAAANRQQ